MMNERERESSQVPSSSSSSPSESNENCFVLKTVNPFDYIKGRSRLERPADIVSSFREKLRFDENLEEEKLKKLFSCKKSKEFEKIFFESFHPVKDVKIFLSESFSEQKSSSRLISPVVCSKVLEWTLDPEKVFVESVTLALINSGHVSLYTNSGIIIDKIIDLKSGSLLLALLHGFTDLSDSGLTKLILFLINSEESKDLVEMFKEYENSSEFKFNEQISVVETCFLALLGMPKSVQLIKKYFLLVKESEIISLLNRLLESLKRLIGLENHFKISSKCLFKAPNSRQIVEWLSVVIDSQYPLCLIQPEILKSIEYVNSFISQEVTLNSNLMKVLPSVKEVRLTKHLDEKQQKDQQAVRISASYVIEPSTI
jgi:hypothetical protein